MNKNFYYLLFWKRFKPKEDLAILVLKDLKKVGVGFKNDISGILSSQRFVDNSIENYMLNRNYYRLLDFLKLLQDGGFVIIQNDSYKEDGNREHIVKVTAILTLNGLLKIQEYENSKSVSRYQLWNTIFVGLTTLFILFTTIEYISKIFGRKGESKQNIIELKMQQNKVHKQSLKKSLNKTTSPLNP